ncbi:uncharacterized protein LOC105220307 [Zeugodacus cucurbitae]|uniref:DUF4706 domain-containing protein n=1 Tax=Zeugodacus cucurbitae TaxID=28588 RepID=A0A0A1WX79_ZEUCU|nr:uncharacterized protein LOC105220307 [Zeugodacus cucurbitae]XP_011195051.1 uncharacterized protein LOC105220307 [Zeugodacus cucurbitae]
MAAFQFSTFNLQVAQDYFAHLNPLAQRISADINATKSTYGQLWNTLKANQQNEIINETLIKPEIILNYFGNMSSSSSSLSSNSSSSSASSANISTTSAEHILQGSPKSREQNYSPNANNSITTNLLTDNIFKQTQNLLSNTLASRSKTTIQSHQLGKLKPPSSPPPPPPITTKTYTKAEKHTKLGSQKALHNDEKTYYFYDGNNLHTYAAQKVALKMIYDDVLGAYRDEHSQPFSYRTKSQIDLQQQYYETDLSDVNLNTNCDIILLTSKEPCNVNLAENATLTKNYEQLQKELKSTLNNHLETIRKNESSDLNQKSGYDMSSKVPTNNCGANKRVLPKTQEVAKIPPALATQAHTSRATNKCESKSKKYFRENSEKHTTEGGLLVDLNTSKQTNFNYAVYTDVYFEQGESATLMHNCSNSGILTASSNSSTTTSDDDERNNYEYDDDDDEKTLCEDIRLLEHDLNLRRGFDFLNNW